MCTIIELVCGFNTQPPEGGWMADGMGNLIGWVSTHSRPKAAGCAVTIQI